MTDIILIGVQIIKIVLHDTGININKYFTKKFSPIEIVLCHIKRTDLGTETPFNESSTIIN